MRIQNINFTTYSHQNIYSFNNRPYENDSVSFSGKDEKTKFQEATNYATMMKIANIIWPIDFQEYDLNKLEGIQQGIKIFDGLSMKEIAFLFEDLHAIAVKRGCSNQCLHCYASAKPVGKDHDDYITRMPFEDFAEMTKGMKTLRNRIGVNLVKHNGKPYTDLYYDADGMEISLLDKNGKEHDFTELNDMFYDATKTKGIFDTAGWNPNNPKMQERAEKYVAYFQDLNNEDKMFQINLSISPFNAIYAKAIELGFDPKNYSVKSQPWHPENNGEKQNIAEKLYNIYIDRMANMMLVFAPLTNSDKFSVISRPVSDFEKNMEHHTVSDYRQIKKHILDTLHEKMQLDVATDKKYVKNKRNVNHFMYKYALLMNNIDTDMQASGRFKELYKKRNPEATEKDFEINFPRVFQTKENYKHLKTNKNLKTLPMKYLKIIDTNGKLYMYDGFRFIPTEVHLNLGTKYKNPPALSPTPEDFVVTKSMIHKKYTKKTSK